MGCTESSGNNNAKPGKGTATQSSAAIAKSAPPAPSAATLTSASIAGSSAAADSAPKIERGSKPALNSTAPPAAKATSGPGSASHADPSAPSASTSGAAPPPSDLPQRNTSMRGEAAAAPLPASGLPDAGAGTAPETVYVQDAQQARDEIKKMGQREKEANVLSKSAPDVVDSAPAQPATVEPPKPKGRVKITVDTKEVQNMMTDDVARYDVGKTLGKGAYGTVKAAKDTKTGEQVAVKVVSKELLAKEKGGEDRLYREVAIMGRLRHNNLVNLMQLVHNADADELWIIVEIVVGKGAGGKGELMHLIDSADNHRLPEKIARDYFQQLVYGINYVHSQKIAHRDLKPENILITKDEVLKITDFGLSNVQNTDTMGAVVADMNLKTCCGTPYYVAPEVVNKDKKGYSGFTADIWSMGVILFVMLTGNLPFTVNKPDLKKLLQKIRQGDFTIPPELEGGGSLSPEAQDTIKQILNPKFEQRVKMHEIARLDWVKVGFNVREMDTDEIDVRPGAAEEMRKIVAGWDEAKEKAKSKASATIGSAAGHTRMPGGNTRAGYEEFKRQQQAQQKK